MFVYPVSREGLHRPGQVQSLTVAGRAVTGMGFACLGMIRRMMASLRAKSCLCLSIEAGQGSTNLGISNQLPAAFDYPCQSMTLCDLRTEG
jgi:hypothetical protein